jgi:glycyl-tRNA synthetase beta chain
MKEHQKYFHVVDDADQLLPCFITVSNMEAEDYSAIISGNEKVIRPRLDDAAFFFETDKKSSLESRREKLKTVIFQAQLGSIFDKTERIKNICAFLSEKLGVDSKNTLRAAELCKSDLVSNMVYEFADMQGIAGYHYALNDGESKDVATAISEHYLPKFAGDALPSNVEGRLVAIADRVDTIVGIFGIGQNPTGSKDPFALRRASVSTLRLIVENEFELDLRELLSFSASQFNSLPKQESVVETALSYVLERFKAWYEEAKISSEVYQAVSSKELVQPLDIHRRVLAVAEFNQSDDAKALAAANKRVANILAKLDQSPEADIDMSLLKEAQEKELATALKDKIETVMPIFQTGNYGSGLSKLADLRTTVDAFFDHVMVMDEDLALRQNRLALLQQLRNLFLEVADISLLVPAK